MGLDTTLRNTRATALENARNLGPAKSAGEFLETFVWVSADVSNFVSEFEIVIGKIGEIVLDDTTTNRFVSDLALRQQDRNYFTALSVCA